MSRFTGCARRVRNEAWPDGLRFVYFHRCVEACARLTGEPFSALFARLGARHGFSREPGRWPDGPKMVAALDALEAERIAYLSRWRQLASARRREKASGRRRPRQESSSE